MWLFPADVYIDRRRVAVATYNHSNESLLDELEKVAESLRKDRKRPHECDHEAELSGFVYVDWLNHHWPIRFCPDCRLITAGRQYWAPIRHKPWEYEPEDVIAAAWNREWPKRGKPRRKRPAPDTPWVGDIAA